MGMAREFPEYSQESACGVLNYLYLSAHRMLYWMYLYRTAASSQALRATNQLMRNIMKVHWRKPSSDLSPR